MSANLSEKVPNQTSSLRTGCTQQPKVTYIRTSKLFLNPHSGCVTTALRQHFEEHIAQKCLEKDRGTLNREIQYLSGFSVSHHRKSHYGIFRRRYI